MADLANSSGMAEGSPGPAPENRIGNAHVGDDHTEIKHIERMVGSVIGSGTVNAGIIAGGDVVVLNLDDSSAMAEFLERFRTLLGEGARPRPIFNGTAFVLTSGDSGLAISNTSAHELIKSTQGLDRYLFRLVNDWREQAQRYVPVAASGELEYGIQPQYGVIRRTEQGYETVMRYEDVRRAAADFSQMSLVGEPGSGKTTALGLLALEGAQQTAQSETAPLPLFVQLSDFRNLTQLPQDFVEHQWSNIHRAPGVLADRLNNGQMMLLLDALNEMPWSHDHPYREWVLPWRSACERWQQMGNRIVVTCRTLDNSEPLDMQEIRLERFDPARIYQFLHLYLGDDEIAVELFQQLQARPGLLDLFSLPYSLMMLVEIAKVSGRDLPRSRAALFTRVVRNALVREIKKNNPHFTDLLLTRRGRDTLQDERFIRRHPYYLADHPLEDVGRLVPALGTLARHMQAGASAEGTGRRLSEAEARSAMQLVLPNKEAQTNALQLGADASILDMDELALPALWFFRHHQLQEYFAGRNLVRRFSAGESVDAQALWTVRWLASDLEPLDPSTLGRGQRYPHVPDSTAWEETTILAAGLLAQDPGHIAALIRAVLPHNPVLAARCLLELQMRPNRCEWPSFSPELEAVAQETRQVLLSRLTNPEADRRARLGAGFALGDLGDPRFTVRHTGAGVRFIAPQWLAIPDGTFLMGSPDSPFDYERPVHPQTMVGFSLATHPVTVVEYACFVAAGGYRDPQWWESGDAQAWRRGELTDLGESWVRSMQAMREQLRPLGEAYVVEWAREQLEDFGREKEHVEILKNAALLDDAAFAAYQEEVRRRYNIPDEQQREQPAFWVEGDLANPSQPVVGVSWYEAQAYCAWLGHCLGMKVRLPTEAEWEYAARGPYGWKYPWGDRFDLDRANVKEGCIRRPTPVGAFPAGASYWGVNDMGGNVWEWTSSVWGSDSSRPTTGKYPYIAGDDREDINAPPIAYRVLRGDSFRIEALGARCAARNWFNPYRQYNDVGFRVATSVR